MDMINYQAIHDMNPWNYTEHQAVNLAVNSSTLTTLMSVTGKGMLEEAIVFAPNYGGTNIEIVISVDGTVILDILQPSIGNVFMLGLYQSADEGVQSGGAPCIFGNENLIGTLPYVPMGYVSKVTFPSSFQQSLSSTLSAIVGLNQPIYFKSSLLVQVKGINTVPNIVAFAKARY